MTLTVLSDAVHGALEAKIHLLIPRSALVQRARLLERLTAVADDVPLVLLAAPAGYGKTTLLSQWAAADGRRFGWITLDKADDDPVRLADHVALTLDRMDVLDRAQALDSPVLRALAAGHGSAHVLALPQLLGSLCRRSQPGVLVLDDAHELRSVESTNFIEALAAYVPPGLHIALGSRLGLGPGLAQLRTEGRCVEFGLDDLAFTEEEARQVLASAGVSRSDEEVSGLVRRTEGWPAGVYLSALAIRAAPGEEVRVQLRAGGWPERPGRPEDGVVRVIDGDEPAAPTAARTSRLPARLVRDADRRRIRSTTTLSAAELAVLLLLTTQLSLAEIGGQRHTSRNTVKSQVAAIHRKLGCSTRSEVVRRGRDLGLLGP